MPPLNDAQKHQLHYFMDASKVRMELCAISELLIDLTCMLLTSKSYLSPKPEISIT